MGLMIDANLGELRNEAAFFYSLFLRGHPLQKLRDDIGVPIRVIEQWQRLAERDPVYKGLAERMLAYRKHVLAIFDSLIFQDLEPPPRLM